MSSIHQLSPGVINKIAAGEVVERPASIVKELMENSVDAGASRVDVTLMRGGTESIHVVDNGCGIPSSELILAISSHATSKIADADDLFRVQTLGFRGEALASIASVSRMALRSRTVQGDSGFQLDVEGGESSEPVPCGCPVGTTLQVRELFYNTPVRRKFLRTPQTEMGHCSEAFIRIALAFPAVHFHLSHNDRTVWDLPPVENWSDRIARLFGNELASSMIWIENSEQDMHLCGYVAHPSHSRANTRMQYLLLNGRHIRDRSLQHALGEAYRGLLMTGRHAIAFLRIDIPPEEVDVNVHPTKLEVRFQDSGRIYSHLLGTIRNRFLTTDLTARLEDSAGPSESDAQTAGRLPQAGVLPGVEENWQKAGHPTQPASVPIPHGSRFEGASQQRLPVELPSSNQISGTDVQTGRGQSPISPFQSDESQAAVEGAVDCQLIPRCGLQVHNRYLITETDEGMIVIDQHALHERILYEQLRTKVLSGSVESQALLVPEPVTLNPSEAAAVLGSRDLLAQLGLDVQPFGGDTVLVSSYPAMLANVSPADLLRQIVELLLSGGKMPDRRDLLDDLLHMVSCKAAIKAGDRLSPEEISELIDQREFVQDSHHCPHGRPTALVFTRQELDRRFGRT